MNKTIKVMNKIIKTLQRVIKDWSLFELILVVIFLPFSLLYILLRLIQEWETTIKQKT